MQRELEENHSTDEAGHLETFKTLERVRDRYLDRKSRGKF